MKRTIGYPRMQWVALVVVIVCGVMGAGERSLADEINQVQPVPPAQFTPDSEPLDLNALEPGNAPAFVVTEDSISQKGLTLPSLWWVKEQFAAQEESGDKLFENWLAYPYQGDRPGRVDFVVNRQFWSLLDYLSRYSFLHKFGSAAKDYGYNIRVFDRQANLLATYTCDFSGVDIGRMQAAQLSQSTGAAPNDSISCRVSLDSTGKAGLSGRTSPFGGVLPK